MVFQRFHLLPALTALDNVVAPVLPYGRHAGLAARAGELPAEVGLSGRENHLPPQLSGGQQQRVALARALIGSPGLLLADEPTGNLDFASGKAVIDLLLRLRTDHGTTLVVVTHDPAVAGARCGRTVWLRDGKVEDDGRPEETGTPEAADTAETAGAADTADTAETAGAADTADTAETAGAAGTGGATAALAEGERLCPARARSRPLRGGPRRTAGVHRRAAGAGRPGAGDRARGEHGAHVRVRGPAARATAPGRGAPARRAGPRRPAAARHGGTRVVKRLAARSGEPLPPGVPGPDAGARTVPCGRVALLGDNPTGTHPRRRGALDARSVESRVLLQVRRAHREA
ncbi:ABC transporter ATP-binding protein [Streptomyces sp. CA-253872]|uniref:ABC transporter ATP-binding protein n=1 Tax=Streptomyces sp. CA-253872 TaxID=3240067 RepID=UPI003D9113B8